MILGSIWDFQEQIRFKDLRHGIGGSISFDTPIGPAEFAVGRSFLLRNDIPNNPISWGRYSFLFFYWILLLNNFTINKTTTLYNPKQLIIIKHLTNTYQLNNYFTL